MDFIQKPSHASIPVLTEVQVLPSHTQEAYCFEGKTYDAHLPPPSKPQRQVIAVSSPDVADYTIFNRCHS